MLANRQQQLLEAFTVDDSLTRLEAMIAEVNLFEAVGAVRQELRHSDFLAFLLNPTGKHGLGDQFLKQFLINVVTTTNSNITAIDIQQMNLSRMIVERESQHIDLLIYDRSIGFVCVIENKIDSSEHTNQLSRYLKAIERRFGQVIQQRLLIFLSPDGIDPVDDDSPYLAIDYHLVHATIKTIRRRNKSMLSPAVMLMMAHYTTMLERHIMTDSEIAKLCRQIYADHKDALDLIFQYRPDKRRIISDTVAEWITNDTDLTVDTHGLEVRFFPTQWMDDSKLQIGTSIWSKHGLLLMFIVYITYDQASVRLLIGPSNDQAAKEKVLDASKQAGITPANKTMGKKHTTLYVGDLVSKTTMKKGSIDDILASLEANWKTFLANDLVRLHQFLSDLDLTPSDT